MNIAFRVDASREIGTGHVIRCLTLADYLAKEGATCHFIVRKQAGNLAEEIGSRGHRVCLLPQCQHASDPGVPQRSHLPPVAGEPPHAHWLDGGWKQDAEQSRIFLNNIQPTWLIVDHYGIDDRWERSLSDCYGKLMVIDDLADRTHNCALLLDQNWHGPGTLRRYDKLCPQDTLKLLGPEYALLGPDYFLLRTVMPPRDGYVSRVLVFLGGSDPGNETEKTIKALSQPDLCDLIIDVVVGANHPDKHGIERLCSMRPKVNIHRNLPGLAGLMAKADLMVGAGGATNWERMCLGLPCIVVSIARNQTPTNRALGEAGYIEFLGESYEVSENDISKAVRKCMGSRELMQSQSILVRSLVPGDGTAKTAAHLIGSQ